MYSPNRIPKSAIVDTSNETFDRIGSKNHKPSYLYTILLSTQDNPFYIINVREKYTLQFLKQSVMHWKNGNEIQTNGAKGEWMNNDPLLCQHDNSHVREFVNRDWLKQWKSAGASN